MVAKKLLRRGSNVYKQGVRGAHSIVKTGIRTPLKMLGTASKGIPLLPGSLRFLDHHIGSGLDSGFGLVRSAPNMLGRSGQIILSPIMPMRRKKAAKPKKKAAKPKKKAAARR